MGLLVPRLSPVGPLGLLSHLPAYIISGIEHTPSHTYLFAPHLVALCIFFFAVPPAVVGRHSMPAIMIPGGFNSLTTQP